MLFIFRVDVGTMINLDMNLALETVAHLKSALASYCNIPVDKQVLLISGGESLESKERVCKYTAGSSDTNPIFLFSVSTLEGSSPPVFTEAEHGGSIHGGSGGLDRDLQPEVETSLNLPDTHNTVAVRASLAQEYVKVSQHQARQCENEIHAQHLQHQGWAAALANLEDSVLALEKRKTSFEEAYGRYLIKRDHYKLVIETFDDDIHILSKIPVLESLMVNNGYSSDSINGGGNGSSADNGKTSMSLLDWINQAGNSSLEQVADSCYRSLEQLDEPFLVNLKGKVGNCIEAANNQQMKEIRGLGDRLSGLEQLLLEATKKVVEQKDLANAFLQNQERASGLRDASILPDLCTSHKQQLLVMMRNHQHIVSIRKRCVKAKEELSLNLYTRLKWVMFIQRQMAESGQELLLYYEELKRLSRRLEVMEQLHLAPSMYLATVVEVVRRKSFSDHFMRKSSLLASNFTSIFTEEVKTRQVFQDKLNKHFLATMFPGMEDMPPPFATVQPDPFDQKLPVISLTDLEYLRGQVPELAQSLSVPDRKTLSSLLTKSLTQDLTQEEDDAMHNLHNLTNKITIQGDGLGSVSVMNRICYDAVTRKKSRLEALAQSRERTLGSDSDTDDDGGEVVKKGKSKISRKMTRSLPGKTYSTGASLSTTVATTNGGGGVKKLSTAADNPSDVAADERMKGNCDGGSGGDAAASSSSVDPSSSTANTNSSAAPSSDGSLLKQKWISSSQVDDKGRDIDDHGVNGVDDQVASIVLVTNSGLQELRSQLDAVRNQVESDKAALFDSVRDTTEKLINTLTQFEASHKPSDVLYEELNEIKVAKLEAEQELDICRQSLETEQNKLDDCNREIEMYRYQLQDVTRALDTLKAEQSEEKSEQEARFIAEQETFKLKLDAMQEKHEQDMRDLRQKLELEHELELDQIKQKEPSHQDDQNGLEDDEVAKLKAEVAEKTREFQELEAKLELLQITGEERIKEEKDKIVRILEAGFSERVRVSLQELETRLNREHEEAMQQLADKYKEEMCSRLEELRQKMISTSQTNLDRVITKKEKEWQDRLREREQELVLQFQQQRQDLEDAKKKEIEENHERERKKSKMEMESLRSRFKMMQYTTNSSATLIDRSPSISESELSFENRVDLVGSPRGGEDKSALEFINEIEVLKRRIRELEERPGRLQTIPGEQEEANGEENDEKNKRIQELEAAKLELEEELNNARQQLSSSSCMQASSLMQASSSCMQASFRVDSNENLRQLQEENRILRDQLTRSMNSLIYNGKVSVSSVERGEIVLVVWSDQHNHYSIYHEGKVLHFLHSDSAELLGLSADPTAAASGAAAKRHTTAEVVDKEYCQAKKPQNRFRVAQGTKFYRVKCRPVNNTGDKQELASK